ncbi:acyl carrier protein [Candidatus Uabimicrobium sp. HlEnr_7]|uniref:acyl carrier protein n=1 Tax=Candidatus Uabimicrobium helgolandensis TaxID=3095367 RepID=UPI00355662E2
MQEVIKNFILEKFLDNDSRGFSSDTDLSKILDSMAFLKLIDFLEKEFAIEIPLNEFYVENFENVNKIILLVERAKNGT